MESLTDLRNTLNNDLFSKIQSSKILVIGAGGIGCELLKNLVLSGFKDIEIIDLDTIDTSNLNRQFLFRSKHVGKPKAMIAKEIIQTFNTNVHIKAYHENIKNNKFNISYFSKFTIVFNALDNVNARKHVNRLCLAANIPLIESGTTGYLGQVTVIKKNITECYECTDKITPKVYPICTIRSTPEKPVHCIVWAKELYKLLFGKKEESMLYEETKDSTYMNIILNYKYTTNNITSYAKELLSSIFILEINKKINMKTYKTSIHKPKPIDLNDLHIKDYINEFIQIIKVIYLNQFHLINTLEFDKDDIFCMRFIKISANLRSHIFNIKKLNLYETKGIAGNIIPAIATTNAIVAGIQVLEAFKILNNINNIKTNCKYTYCNRYWDSRGVIINPISIPLPNKNCYICNKNIIHLYIDCNQMILKDLIQNILKNKIGMNEPTIAIGSTVLYEEGEDAFENANKFLNKILNTLPGGGIINGKIITIEDFTQSLEVDIIIHQIDNKILQEKEITDLFILSQNELTLNQQKKRKNVDITDDIQNNINNDNLKKLKTN